MNDIQKYATEQFIHWKKIEPEIDFRFFVKHYLKDESGKPILDD